MKQDGQKFRANLGYVKAHLKFKNERIKNTECGGAWLQGLSRDRRTVLEFETSLTYSVLPQNKKIIKKSRGFPVGRWRSQQPCLAWRRADTALLAGQAWLKTSSAALGGGNHSSELSPRQELDVGQAPPWSLSQSQHKPPLAAKNTGVQPGFVSTSSLLGIPHPGRHDSSRKNTQTRREPRGIGRQAVLGQIRGALWIQSSRDS